MKTIHAIVHTAEEGGFWAEVPALPGCFTEADTREELEISLSEAVEGWFEAQASLTQRLSSGQHESLLTLAV